MQLKNDLRSHTSQLVGLGNHAYKKKLNLGLRSATGSQKPRNEKPYSGGARAYSGGARAYSGVPGLTMEGLTMRGPFI